MVSVSGNVEGNTVYNSGSIMATVTDASGSSDVSGNYESTGIVIAQRET